MIPLEPGADLRQTVAIHRYSNWLLNEQMRLLRTALGNVSTQLSRDFATLGPRDQAQLVAVGQRVTALMEDLATQGAAFTVRELQSFATFSAQLTQKNLTTLMKTTQAKQIVDMGNLSMAQVRAAASYPIQGIPLGDWWTRTGVSLAHRIQGNIAQGILTGASTQSIYRDISTAKYRELSSMTRTQLQTLTKTVIAGVESAAQFDTISNMGSNVSVEFEYVATLDTRTSLICQGLDGKRFRYDDPQAKRPPQHFNCRSVMRAILNTTALGLPASVNKRRPSWPTYTTWLRAQPSAVVKDILGADRAELFRGGVALDQLVRDDMTTKSLAELRSEFSLRPLQAMSVSSAASKIKEPKT